jgi:hypothetical protein
MIAPSRARPHTSDKVSFVTFVTIGAVGHLGAAKRSFPCGCYLATHTRVRPRGRCGARIPHQPGQLRGPAWSRRAGWSRVNHPAERPNTCVTVTECSATLRKTGVKSCKPLKKAALIFTIIKVMRSALQHCCVQCGISWGCGVLIPPATASEIHLCASIGLRVLALRRPAFIRM